METLEPVQTSAALRIGLLVNEKSGSVQSSDVAGQIRQVLEGGGGTLVASETIAGDVDGAIRALLARKVQRLIVHGGDGTIAAAAKALTGTDIELAVLPGGTMNLLAKDLGIPLDLGEAVENAVHGSVKSIDVGLVNDEVFLISSMLGFPTRLQRHREAFRQSARAIVWVRMAIAGIFAFERYPRLSLTLNMHGETRDIRTRALSITKADIVNKMDPQATGGPGKGVGEDLFLYILQPVSKLQLLRFAVDLVRNRVSDKDMTVVSAEAFVVESKRRRLNVMNDGERKLMQSPLRYRIMRRGLRVVVPAE